MLQELEQDNLKQVIEENSLVVVQYSAGWCGNCRIMKPKFKKMASENQSAVFMVVDAEQYPESRKLAEVDNLPTFAVFKDGELYEQAQTNKAEILRELVSRAL